MLRLILTAGATLACVIGACTAHAESVKTEVTASNGVVVTVYSDEFASRYEYSAPSIDFTDGWALAVKVAQGGETTDTFLTGAMSYRGEWRRYNSAIFKGGAPADFTESGREVMSCSGSRYGGGCRLREKFRIEITPDQIASYAENGVIPIQIRAQDSTTNIMQVPTAYIDAVNEVAARRSH